MKRELNVIVVTVIVAAIVLCLALSGNQVIADEDYQVHYWSFDGTTKDASTNCMSEDDTSAVYDTGKNAKGINMAESEAIATKKIDFNVKNGLTIASWFKLNDTSSGYSIILAHGDTGAGDIDQGRFQLYFEDCNSSDGGGYIRFYAPSFGDPFTATTKEKSFVQFDKWAHLAATYDGTTLRLYLNGTEVSNATGLTLGTSADVVNYLRLGALLDDSFHLDGMLDELVFANFALSPAQIGKLVNDPASAGKELKSWSDGTVKVTPAPTPVLATPDPNATAAPTAMPLGGTAVMYWSFDDTEREMSKYKLDADYDGLGLYYGEGKLGKALSVDGEAAIRTDCIPMPLKAFTASFWLNYESCINGEFGVLLAMGSKDDARHFEIYTRENAETDKLWLCIYSPSANAKDYICEFNKEEWHHIAVAFDGYVLKVYFDGDEVTSFKYPLQTGKLSEDTEDFMAFGSLIDSSLTIIGKMDEMVIADHAFTSELISKLAKAPAEGKAEVEALVKAVYPAGETPRPEVTPTPVPTSKPTEPPKTAEATATKEVPKATQASNETGKSDNSILIVVIIVVAAIIAAGIVIVIIKKVKA